MKCERRPIGTDCTVFRQCFILHQCLGSGSVGSARLWLPGSGSAKICGSTDPDPRGKISKIHSQNPNLNY